MTEHYSEPAEGRIYWLGVCQGREAAVRYAMVETPAEAQALVEEYAILMLPEFPDAMQLLAEGRGGAAVDETISALLATRAKDLRNTHVQLCEHFPGQYAGYLAFCALSLIRDSEGLPEVNLGKAIQLCQLARDMGDEIVRFYGTSNEADARFHLAHRGIDPLHNLEVAADLYRQCRATSREDSEYVQRLANEAQVRQQLAELGKDAEANCGISLALLAEARRKTADSQLQFMFYFFEGHSLRSLGDNRVDPQVNYLKAIEKFQQARTGLSAESFYHAASLGAEGTARMHLGELGIDPGANFEEALRLTTAAMKHFSRESLDYAKCAMQQGDLSRNLAVRGTNTRMNLQQALETYKAAEPTLARLDQLSLGRCVFNQAKIHMWIGNLVTQGMTSQQAVEYKRDHAHKALNLFEQALAYFEPGTTDYGQTLSDSALSRVLLSGLSWGDERIGHLERANDYYVRALQNLPKSSRLYSMTVHDAGQVHRKLAASKVTVEEDLKQAIRLFNESAGGLERDGLWDGRRQFNVADALLGLAKCGVDKEINLAEAVIRLTEAQRIFQDCGTPDDVIAVGKLLGVVLLEQGADREAHAAFAEAIAKLDSFRPVTAFMRDRQRWIEKYTALHDRMVECCLKLNLVEDALEYVDRGRSRTLIDLLTLERVEPDGAAVEKFESYRRLRAIAEAMEATLRTDLFDSWVERDEVGRLVSEKLGILPKVAELETELREIAPELFSPAKPLDIRQIKSVAGRVARPLVVIWTGETNGAVFFVTPDGRLEYEFMPELSRDRVAEWLFRVDDSKPTGWLDVYSGLREGIFTWKDWRAQIETTLRLLDDQLISTVCGWLRRNGYQQAALIVSGDLALLPLHAAYRSENGERRYALDEFEFIAAPSIAMLDQYSRREEAFAVSILGVGNPDDSLFFSRAEVEAIVQLAADQHPGPHTTLFAAQATADEVLSRLANHSIVHFACHGTSMPFEPLLSGLALAGDADLMLSQLLQRGRQPNPRVVVLSACETSVGINPGARSDEYFGLPAGFLVGGARTVIGSLWIVDDLATFLLMQEMYKRWFQGESLASALRQAQLAIRELTTAEVEERVLQAEHAQRGRPRDLSDSRQVATPDTDRPFANPYYWAGFVLYGEG